MIQQLSHLRNPLMEKAIDAAKKTRLTGDVPVGAVIVWNNEVIGIGWNKREALQQTFAHAEMLAIQEACNKLGTWKLNKCDMYVTLEPCTMCASAIIQSRMRSLYFGAWDKKAGAAGSVTHLFQEKWVNHKVDIYEGIMENECKELLNEFFKDLRLQNEGLC